MKNYNLSAVAKMVIGAVLIAITFLPNLPLGKNILGVCLGLGMGLFGVGLSQVLGNNYARKNPSYAKAQQIEEQDERNQQITHRAKASAADLTQWGILGIAYISIYMGYPLLITAIIVGVYGAYHFMTWKFVNHYQKMM